MSPVSDDVRRFLLANVSSIPHLELLLLLWRERRSFGTEEIARRLYVPPAMATELAESLCANGQILRDEAGDGFHLREGDPELRHMLDRIDRLYARHVRAVAEVVHGTDQVKSSL